MKLNRSLAISSRIQECKAGNILGLLENEFPSSVLEEQDRDSKSRSRVFTESTTLLTMVLTATQQDKSLKNSVDLYYTIHQQHKQQALEELEKEAQKQRELDEKSERKPGSPKKYN